MIWFNGTFRIESSKGSEASRECGRGSSGARSENARVNVKVEPLAVHLELLHS